MLSTIRNASMLRVSHRTIAPSRKGSESITRNIKTHQHLSTAACSTKTITLSDTSYKDFKSITRSTKTLPSAHRYLSTATHSNKSISTSDTGCKDFESISRSTKNLAGAHQQLSITSRPNSAVASSNLRMLHGSNPIIKPATTLRNVGHKSFFRSCHNHHHPYEHKSDWETGHQFRRAPEILWMFWDCFSWSIEVVLLHPLDVVVEYLTLRHWAHRAQIYEEGKTPYVVSCYCRAVDNGTTFQLPTSIMRSGVNPTNKVPGPCTLGEHIREGYRATMKILLQPIRAMDDMLAERMGRESLGDIMFGYPRRKQHPKDKVDALVFLCLVGSVYAYACSGNRIQEEDVTSSDKTDQNGGDGEDGGAEGQVCEHCGGCGKQAGLNEDGGKVGEAKADGKNGDATGEKDKDEVEKGKAEVETGEDEVEKGEDELDKGEDEVEDDV